MLIWFRSGEFELELLVGDWVHGLCLHSIRNVNLFATTRKYYDRGQEFQQTTEPSNQQQQRPIK